MFMISVDCSYHQTEWDQARYEGISQELKRYLQHSGWKESKMAFVPCSGILGENLVDCKTDGLSKWYQGPALIRQLGT